MGDYFYCEINMKCARRIHFILLMMMSSKNSCDLIDNCDIFESSYLVLHSCKISYPGLDWFKIYDRGLCCPPS